MKNDMFLLFSLTKRNVKLYFKDKVTFFMSLITPLILLVLFILFLKNVYVSSIEGVLADYNTFDSKLIGSFANSWLVSSLLSVSCVTVAFCSGTIMVDDKLSNAVLDIDVSPVKKGVKYLSYLCSTFIATLIIAFILLIIGFIYLAITGWYLSVSAVLLIILNIILTTLVGSIIATLVNSCVKTQGGLSAVATMASSMYGFLCGAYMPLSQYPKGIRMFLCINPGTYANHLFKHLFMSGPLKEMSGLPSDIDTSIRDAFDVNLYFSNKQISYITSMIILIFAVVLSITVFILINRHRSKKSR